MTLGNKIMVFLSSMVIGFLGAFFILYLIPDSSQITFLQQVLIVGISWICLGVVSYFVILSSVKRYKKLASLFLVELDFQQTLRKIFLATFFLFPIFIIAFRHVKEFFQITILGRVFDLVGWMTPVEGAGVILLTSLLVGILVFLLLFFVIGRKPRIVQYLNELPDYYYILFILLAGASIKLFFMFLLNTQPLSDFEIINSDAILIAKGASPQHMYVAVHVITTVIYGYLYRFFGSDLMVIKTFHLILYALSGVFIYYAGKVNFEQKLWSGIAGALITTWPSLALYSNVLTPEHLFIFFECVLMFVVSYFFQGQTKQQFKMSILNEVIGFSIIGILLGFMGMFRPFNQIFLIAFIITFFVYSSNFDLKRLFLNGAVLLIFVLILGRVPVVVAEHYQNHFGSIRPCNLLVGMNVDALGQYNVEDTAVCHEILASTSSETIAMQKVIEVVLERLQGRQDLLISFFDQKFAILWANSNGILFWVLNLPNGSDLRNSLDVIQKVNLIDFSMMFLATWACVIGVVLVFFKDIKPAVFWGLLSFFAFNLMELIFEVQTRYRTVVMPLFIFFACWALSHAYSSITRKFTKTLGEDLEQEIIIQ